MTDMSTNFEAGQVWTRGKGVWETGKRIVEVDQRRRSVVFLKTMPLNGGMGEKWESADMVTAWIEDEGASLKQVS
jgi:hypothetical protein